MAICVGVDTFLVGENQVWHFKMEITDFKSLFKPYSLQMCISCTTG
jgi:hypothetical protein